MSQKCLFYIFHFLIKTNILSSIAKSGSTDGTNTSQYFFNEARINFALKNTIIIVK